jgi:hypothetical protein
MVVLFVMAAIQKRKKTLMTPIRVPQKAVLSRHLTAIQPPCG